MSFRQSLALFTVFTAMREVSRSMNWERYSEKKLVGAKTSLINTNKNSTTADLVAWSVVFFQSFPPFSPSIETGPALIGAVLSFFAYTKFFMLHHGNLKEIPSLYFDKKTGMWDWPRKRDGGDGGTTQTDKLVQGIKDIGKKLTQATGGLGPRPAFGMDRVGILPHISG